MDDTEAVRIAAEKASDWGSPMHVHALVLLALTGVGLYLCYGMAAPFVPALAWALALAVLFVPLHRWLERKFNGRSMAALLCVLAAAVIVVVPALFVVDRVAAEAGKGAVIAAGGVGPAPVSFLRSMWVSS